MRAIDWWDSARFIGIFLSSRFSCSQALSKPARQPLTPAVGRSIQIDTKVWDMSSEETDRFAVYNLRTSFSNEPGDIRYCPLCKVLVVKSSIPPSAAVVDDLKHHSGISLDYTYLYECPSCKWWSVRESWLDLNGAGWHDFLIIGSVAVSTSSNIVIDQEQSDWSRVLQNKEIYSKAIALPSALKHLFSDSTNEK